MTTTVRWIITGLEFAIAAAILWVGTRNRHASASRARGRPVWMLVTGALAFAVAFSVTVVVQLRR